MTAWELAIAYPNRENKSTSTQWYVHREGETVYMSFQGSVDKMDWMQNFSFWKIPYKNMAVKFWVHSGIFGKYKSIRDEVLKEVATAKKVVLSGFSQGAGIATFAHEDILYHYPHIEIESTAYSGPRVLGWFAPKKRWATLQRFTFRCDLIPGLPPWLFGFKHVGNHSHLGKGPKWLHVCPLDHMKIFEYMKEIKK